MIRSDPGVIASQSLSEDLLSRLIAAVDAGMSRRDAAERFGVAVATSIWWVSAWRRDGSTCARPRGGDIGSHRIEAYRAVVLAAIDAQVDIMLTELADRLRQQYGASFARSTVWKLLDRHGVSTRTFDELFS